MSPPAVNWPPAPVSTTKRTASSRSSSAKSAASWSRASIETRLSFPGTSRVIVATPRVCIALDPEAVVFGHTLSFVSSRRILRRIFPDALFGSAGTKRYSRGRLKRASVRGEAVRVELLGRRLADDDRDDALPEAVVGGADDRHLADAGVAREHVLDLERMDVLAAGDDHVVERGRRPRGRRRRRDGPCRPCGTSRRGSPSRRHPGGSSSRRTPRRPRGERRSRPLGSSFRRVLTAGRPAQPGLATWSRPDRERVDLGRAVVVDEHLGREDLDAAGRRASRSSRRLRTRAPGRSRRSCSASRSALTRSWNSVGARYSDVIALLSIRRKRLVRIPARAAGRSSHRRGAWRGASGCPSCGRAASPRGCDRRGR